MISNSDTLLAGSRSAAQDAVVAAVRASLDPLDKKLKLKPEYVREHAKGCDPATGFCSIAAEAVWAMLGGNQAGYLRFWARADGDTHWWILDSKTGRVVDPTASQFDGPFDYSAGKRGAPPVTVANGVLFRGDRGLLISKKAAHLIAKASELLRA